MKKFLIFLVFFVLLSSLILAEGQQGTNAPGTGQNEGNDDTSGSGQGVQTNTETQTQQQNQGEESQVQNQVRSQIQAGSYSTESGKQVQVQTQNNNRIELKAGAVSAQTSMQMTQQQTQSGTKLQVQLSNGKNAEVKLMPDTASERALEQLRMKVCSEENNCSIELKEVGSGEQVRAAYEIQAQKQAKVLGLFKTKMQVQAQVDAENGEVIQAKKPWWAFLASEAD